MVTRALHCEDTNNTISFVCNMKLTCVWYNREIKGGDKKKKINCLDF